MIKPKSFRFFIFLIFLLCFCLFTLQQVEAGTITGRVGEAIDTDGDGIPRLKAEWYGSSDNRENFVEGEVLVRFKEYVSEKRIEEINESLGATVIEKFDFIDVYHLKIPPGVSVPEMVEKYLGFPEVLYAEPNYLREID